MWLATDSSIGACVLAADRKSKGRGLGPGLKEESDHQRVRSLTLPCRRVQRDCRHRGGIARDHSARDNRSIVRVGAATAGCGNGTSLAAGRGLAAGSNRGAGSRATTVMPVAAMAGTSTRGAEGEKGHRCHAETYESHNKPPRPKKLGESLPTSADIPMSIERAGLILRNISQQMTESAIIWPKNDAFDGGTYVIFLRYVNEIFVGD